MKWAVVGSGVLGMRLAQRLAEEGHAVTLYEATSTLGGLASPWQLGDVVWDRHYHVTLLSDAETRAMYASLGLDRQTHWVETKTGYYGPDRTMRSVSNVVEFFRLPGLTMLDKLRLGGTIFYGSKIRNGRRMEGIGVDRWLRRWSGRRAFETFWLPLLRAKLGDEHDKVSAAFIWATIQRLYAARRRGLKKELFGYVHGGYASVCLGFQEWFTDHGVDVRLESTVREISSSVSTYGGLRVRADAGTEVYDKVAVTLAAPLAARLCPSLLDAERRRLERVEYIGVVVVSLLLDEPLGPSYLTYITDTETPFTAVVEMTSLIDPSEVGGRALVYLPKYTTPEDPLFSASDDAIVAEFLGYLSRMYPNADLRDSAIVASRVSRVRQVFALPTIGYSDTSPSICTSLPGLYLVGSANLPFSTLNVNDTLSLVDAVLHASDNG